MLLSLAACVEADAPISSDQPQTPANASGVDSASMLSGGPLMIADQGYFYVGGQYTDIPAELNLEPAAPQGTRTNPTPTRYYGQMYVEYQIPSGVPQDLPIVLVHGGSRTGADYLMTPDGRPGWRDFFLRRGFPSFDNYYAGGIGSMQDREMQNQMNIDGLAALLDRIGPAIVVVHSQSGAYGWPLVQARPDLVKALVALEPSGPPVHGVSFHGAPEWFTVEGGWKPWGLTITPLEYAPALSGPEDLQFAQENEAESPEHIRCWLQGETVRGLTGFDNSPILVVESEASFYAPYNYCTVKYLEQAGVETDYVKAQDEGLPGGGHMFMAELDSDNIAQLVHDWLSERVDELR
jgi:pimeloyl-ACP methyl ester carboxylesterase